MAHRKRNAIPACLTILLDSIYQKGKKKLLNRVNRIKRQLNAIEKALEGDDDCSGVLQTIAACRGAINGLLARVLSG